MIARLSRLQEAGNDDIRHSTSRLGKSYFRIRQFNKTLCDGRPLMAKAKASIIVLKSLSNRLVINGFKVLILSAFKKILWHAEPLTYIYVLILLYCIHCIVFKYLYSAPQQP